MDRRERDDDMVGALIAALRGWQSEIWTSCIATVVSWDSVANTVNVQPSHSLQRQIPDGTFVTEKLPVLVNCPVIFPQAGPFALTFPIAAGDEGVVVFSSRSIDSWHQSGGYGLASDKRMHNLSDGAFLPGLRNQTRKLSAISTTDVQLRNAAGTAVVSIDPAAHVNITCIEAHVNASSSTVINSPTTTVFGDMNVTGTLTVDTEIISALGTFGDIAFGTPPHSLDSHIHTGGTLTGGKTGPVV